MKKNIRLLGVIAGLFLVTATGGAYAYADSGEGRAPAKEQYRQHKNHRHQGHHRKQNRHRNQCRCDQKEQRSDWRQRERFAKLADKLGLSNEQKTRIKEVFKKNRPEGKPIVTNLIHEKRELKTLVRFGNADEAAIRAQAAKVAKFQADLAVHRAQMYKQMRTILTPEQVEKFKVVQKERDDRIDKFREQRDEHHRESGQKQ
jgi:protein CpxP